MKPLFASEVLRSREHVRRASIEAWKRRIVDLEVELAESRKALDSLQRVESP